MLRYQKIENYLSAGRYDSLYWSAKIFEEGCTKFFV